MSAMKKPSLQKKIIFTAIFAVFFLISNPSLAWNGYDYDNKAEIEIGPGNLMREGLTFQFYDMKNDSYHTAKVISMDSSAGGTRIQLQDLETKKERVFMMQN
jgi:hypothetical protein